MRLSVSAAISHGRVFRRLGLGPESRIHLLRNLLTGLVRHERIEASWARVDEMRGYAEKLIDYGKLGDTNERAMRMADFWLTEKDLIPKLFQVLAPRFQDQNGGYTRMLQIPNSSQQDRAKMAVQFGDQTLAAHHHHLQFPLSTWPMPTLVSLFVNTMKADT
uniref:39S ribosomal protein L17, mitochondrial n=1 Tax=Ictidomys tridecemlineatus TaxID=43179 RepID=UPI0006813598|nr:39S ribosomal protein L17, mitochondrial [Ictidomys tridecemlineatus]